MARQALEAAIDEVEELKEDNPDVSPALRQQVRLTKVYQLLHRDAALVTWLVKLVIRISIVILVQFFYSNFIHFISF